MRLGKRERAALRAKQGVRTVKAAKGMRVPESVGKMRSVWDNLMPRGKPSRAWDYDGRKAGVIHRQGIRTC